MPPHVRRRVYLVIIIQILIGFLDLLGVLTVGVIGSLAVNGIQSRDPGDKVSQVLNFIGISDLAFQQQVAILGIAASALLISRTIISVIIIRKTIYFLSRRSSELSGKLIKKLLRQDLLFIREKSSQETLFALTTGASSVTTGVIGSLVGLIADLSLLIVLASGLLVLDFGIAIGTFLLFGSVGAYLYFNLHKKAELLGDQSTKLTIESNEKMLQVLDSYREMIVRNRRFYFAEQISQTRLKLADVSAELAFMPNVSKYTIEAATILGILLISASQFILTDATNAVAALSVFIVAGARIAPAILRMQQGAIQIKNSIAVAQPTFDFIDKLSLLQEIEDPGENLDFNHNGFNGYISVKDISFSYPNSTNLAISNANFEIQKGEQIAIVGNSGAGKTTLVDLLLGIMKPNSGKVIISGESPEDAVKKWPGAIAYVPQDIHVVSGSILDNITLGFQHGEVNEEKLNRAIQLSNLGNFVNSLDEGLKYEVGEFGSKLSGGQKQRIALARALYLNPKVIILDEATSSLDAQSENEISSSIKKLKGEFTVILIAHRLSTVRDATKVIYLENGKIIASGTFEEVRKMVPDFDNQANLMGL